MVVEHVRDSGPEFVEKGCDFPHGIKVWGRNKASFPHCHQQHPLLYIQESPQQGEITHIPILHLK